MTKSYQICITVCTGLTLLSWEVLALIIQGWTGKKWGAPLFAFLGGFLMAAGLLSTIIWNVLSKKKKKQAIDKKKEDGEEEDPQKLPTIEVTPIDDERSDVEVVETEAKKNQERADFIFDLVNLSTAMLTIIITVLFLNTFSSLWVRNYIHGKGYVRLGYGLGEGTRSLISPSPIIGVLHTTFCY